MKLSDQFETERDYTMWQQINQKMINTVGFCLIPSPFFCRQKTRLDIRSLKSNCTRRKKVRNIIPVKMFLSRTKRKICNTITLRSIRRVCPWQQKRCFLFLSKIKRNSGSTIEFRLIWTEIHFCVRFSTANVDGKNQLEVVSNLQTTVDNFLFLQLQLLTLATKAAEEKSPPIDLGLAQMQH